NILSTYLGGYAYADGTSMAAPMVSGTLALMLADNPSLTATQLKGDLLASVRPIPQLAGLSVTGGELDAAAAVESAGNTPIAASPPTSPAGGGTSQPAPTPTVQHSPVRRRGISLSHVAVRAQALVFTLSARARVQIRLRRAAGDVLRLVVSGRRGANRYALSSLLHGRRVPRGRYVL